MYVRATLIIVNAASFDKICSTFLKYKYLNWYQKQKFPIWESQMIYNNVVFVLKVTHAVL